MYTIFHHRSVIKLFSVFFSIGFGILSTKMPESPLIILAILGCSALMKISITFIQRLKEQQRGGIKPNNSNECTKFSLLDKAWLLNVIIHQLRLPIKELHMLEQTQLHVHACMSLHIIHTDREGDGRGRETERIGD